MGGNATIRGGSLNLRNNSSLTGGGTLANVTNPFGSDVNISDSNGPIISGTLANNGTIELYPKTYYAALTFSGDVTLAGNGQLVMHPSGSSSFGAYLSFSGTLTNGPGHTIRGAGRFENSMAGTLVNQGTILAENGSLTINGPVAQISGNTLEGGTWIVFANSTLDISGAKITINQAMITLSGIRSTFSNIDGLTTNAGSLSILNGRNFTTVAAFTNSGSLIIGAGSTLHVPGDFTLTAMSTLSIQIAGPADDQFSHLEVSGEARIAGTLNISLMGFKPSAGDRFMIVTCHPLSGQFAIINGLKIGMGLLFAPIYNTGDFSLLVAMG